jgi:hypothetical protein
MMINATTITSRAQQHIRDIPPPLAAVDVTQVGACTVRRATTVGTSTGRHVRSTALRAWASRLCS